LKVHRNMSSDEPYNDEYEIINLLNIGTFHGDKAENHHHHIDRKRFDYENALSIIGFGRFQYVLSFIMGIIIINESVQIISISFILPSTECDFQMTNEQKGYLSTITFIGSTFV
jgi:hypothetical protein